MRNTTQNPPLFNNRLTRLKRFTVQTLVMLSVIIGGFCILLFVTKEGKTPSMLDANGNSIPGAIAEERMILLGGVEQYVLLRGKNKNSPLLVYVHGGPGMTATPFLRTYNKGLEDHFLVVYWEQRGTSNSYSDALDPATMSINQITEDLSELVNQLTREFDQEKVLLIGHSWGTIPALAYSATAQNKINAYIGVSQTVNQVKSDTIGYEWALAEAHKRRLDKAIKTLEGLGAPPYNIDEFIAQRKQVNFLGGGMIEPISDLQAAWIALQTEEFTWPKLGPLVSGVQFSGTALWEEQQKFDALSRYPTLDVPIFLLLGRHDRIISSKLGEDCFNAITAPDKELIWFENSAHAPQFEEPDVFNATIIRIAQKIGLLE